MDSLDRMPGSPPFEEVRSTATLFLLFLLNGLITGKERPDAFAALAGVKSLELELEPLPGSSPLKLRSLLLLLRER